MQQSGIRVSFMPLTNSRITLRFIQTTIARVA
jgi:hypothetical protein